MYIVVQNHSTDVTRPDYEVLGAYGTKDEAKQAIIRDCEKNYSICDSQSSTPDHDFGSPSYICEIVDQLLPVPHKADIVVELIQHEEI